jgi:hypothetical protein
VDVANARVLKAMSIANRQNPTTDFSATKTTTQVNGKEYYYFVSLQFGFKCYF